MKDILALYQQYKHWIMHPASLVAGGLLIFFLILNVGLGFWYERNFNASSWLQIAEEYEVKIGENEWGAPFIEGARNVDVAFGVAIAQGKLALDDVETMIRIQRGTLGVKEGVKGAKADFLMQLVRSRKVAEKHLAESLVEPEVLAFLQGYVDGLNYYAATNSGEVDKELYPVTLVDVLAGFNLQHLLFYGLQDEIIDLVGQEDRFQNGEQLVQEMPENPSENANSSGQDNAADNIIATEGSNAIAVGPGKSWGSTYLVINSHQPVDGPFSWFHMAVQSDEGMQAEGGSFPGSPFVYVGFNDNLGWGVTVNKPDLTDQYLLVPSETNPQQSYRYDGLDQDYEEVTFSVPVTLFWNLRFEKEFTRKYSVHGPVFETAKGNLALWFQGNDNARQAEQWYAMQMATNYEQWMDAMSLRTIQSFNFVYADKLGNLAFLYNAALRMRPEGTDLSKPLPGDDSQWLQIPTISFERMPKIIKPVSAYIYSANHEPFSTTSFLSAPQKEDYPDSWGVETRMSNRALVLREFFKTSHSISQEQIKALKYDHSYHPEFEGVKKINRLIHMQLPEDLKAAQQVLASWDLKADKLNEQASLAICVMRANWKQKDRDTQDESLIADLTDCRDTSIQQYGSLIPLWGDTMKLAKGDLEEPLSGGPDTLRAVYGDYDASLGAKKMRAGDGLHFFVFWDRAQEQTVYGIHQFGSSRKSSNRHYNDQLQLFAQEQELLLRPLEKGFTKKVTFPE